MVRPGIALYGSNPVPKDRSKCHSIMHPVVTLRCKVIQRKIIDQNGYVGYGATYPVIKGTKLLIAEYGYADGLPRSLSNNGYVEVIVNSDNVCSMNRFHGIGFDGPLRRYRLPIAGKVSMDLCTIDATTLPDDIFAKVDYVELINDHLTIDDIAKDANTVAYKILIRLGNRYGRIYYDL